MEELYRSYLTFLRSMAKGLENLTNLAEKKYAAAQKDDLLTLNELVNQEQAQSLNFRGLELTRNKLLPQLGLENVPMEQVPDHFPPEMREEARQAVKAVRSRYQMYQLSAKKARSLLEQSLREVERTLQSMGGPPAAEPGAPGYEKEAETAAPPPSMKTDFRA